MKAGQGVPRILLAGVGGQGVLSAAGWVGQAFLAAGHEVMVSQAHGMSQRGGSVTATVVVDGGGTAEIGAGEADCLVALEPMEGVRAAPRLRPGALAVVSPEPVAPYVLAMKGQDYPALERLLAALRERPGRVVVIEAARLAAASGSPRSANIVLLGALVGTGSLELPAELLLEAILADLPAEAQPAARLAFAAGHRDAEASAVADGGPRGGLS